MATSIYWTQMIAELKDLSSPGIIDLRKFSPNVPELVWLPFEALIGVKGVDGGDIFQFTLCTPQGLAAQCPEGGFLFGHGLIIVPQYDLAALNCILTSLCSSVSGDQWINIAGELAGDQRLVHDAQLIAAPRPSARRPELADRRWIAEVIAMFTFGATDGLRQREGSGTTTAFTFTVLRTGDTAVPASVGYAVSGLDADLFTSAPLTGVRGVGSLPERQSEKSVSLVCEQEGDTAATDCSHPTVLSTIWPMRPLLTPPASTFSNAIEVPDHGGRRWI